MADLKKCPFCEGERVEIKPWGIWTQEMVVCMSCHASGPMTSASGCVAEKWNNRPLEEVSPSTSNQQLKSAISLCCKTIENECDKLKKQLCKSFKIGEL